MLKIGSLSDTLGITGFTGFQLKSLKYKKQKINFFEVTLRVT